eukprot:g2157.t1
MVADSQDHDIPMSHKIDDLVNQIRETGWDVLGDERRAIERQKLEDIEALNKAGRASARERKLLAHLRDAIPAWRSARYLMIANGKPLLGPHGRQTDDELVLKDGLGELTDGRQGERWYALSCRQKDYVYCQEIKLYDRNRLATKPISRPPEEVRDDPNCSWPSTYACNGIYKKDLPHHHDRLIGINGRPLPSSCTKSPLHVLDFVQSHPTPLLLEFGQPDRAIRRHLRETIARWESSTPIYTRFATAVARTTTQSAAPPGAPSVAMQLPPPPAKVPESVQAAPMQAALDKVFALHSHTLWKLEQLEETKRQSAQQLEHMRKELGAVTLERNFVIRMVHLLRHDLATQRLNFRRVVRLMDILDQPPHNQSLFKEAAELAAGFVDEEDEEGEAPMAFYRAERRALASQMRLHPEQCAWLTCGDHSADRLRALVSELEHEPAVLLSEERGVRLLEDVLRVHPEAGKGKEK